MYPENLDRLSTAMKAQKLEAVLLASPANITWLSGYAASIQTGPSPFDGGPALGWLFQGQLSLLVNDWEGEAAGATGAQAQTYVGYTVDEPLDCTPRMAAALAELLKPFARLKGRIGAELNHLPAALFMQLQSSLPEVEIVNLGDDLTPMRAVKTADEIARLKAAIHLSDLAQQEIRGAIQPGVTELELYERVKARIEYEAGGRVPVLLDLVAGERTAYIGGLPTGYALQAGDPLILDFVARLDGYWGDNCAVYFAGEPTTELEKIYRVVTSALRAGVAAVRPGLKAGDLDELVRSSIGRAGFEPYPHHTGHGLGTTYHEEPRIVSYNTAALQPGMVIALEPGIYIPGTGGVRLEDVVLVTQDGCQVLTTHLKDN